VVELADDVVLRFAGTDTERTSHDLDEGTKRRERTVGPAAAGQDRHAALLQAAAELMQQSRLADAGLAYDVDDARPSRRLAKLTFEHVDFVDAPDIGRETFPDRGGGRRLGACDGSDSGDRSAHAVDSARGLEPAVHLRRPQHLPCLHWPV